ncbi:hypothetical protein EMIHUDRAFT_229266 [Emiliania huxleyi CCMP1516]|uniref:SHOCT domain-containing protein n=2 Tax=Emiliania huxleyi TaxID=2903 RepID=A0A0D3KDD1_EMIH1|nr:hypothetical protein EMIHUDRAFT_229266 [Emiliania huxleyi CCMP1516]EOD33766.1 hypothetical protein EMIHUDRAFT_229266 [Emiliania huxleyi CCMP1516]|eukprot:XP_005786195.1 hypothetical protein EMIHUDRAFT_229266 [Emiliania huxleyi CCMP1516]
MCVASAARKRARTGGGSEDGDEEPVPVADGNEAPIFGARVLGQVTTLTLEGEDGPLSLGSAGVASDHAGACPDASAAFVADWSSHEIRRVEVATGAVTTLAGSGEAGDADGVGDAAEFFSPAGIAISPDGSALFVVDFHNDKIRRVELATGAVTTIAGSGNMGSADGVGDVAEFYNPCGIAISPDGGALFVVDNNKIRRVEVATGAVTTLAGSGEGGDADGVGDAAQFCCPSGIAPTAARCLQGSRQWCTEIKVGTWQSGEATVTFERDIFSWITKREVPDCGFITLKIRTSSIHEAVFDKRSNVLKIRGMVEVPMDKLDRYYDPYSSLGSPKGYLCLKFQNYGEFTKVVKAVPRLKARTTFQNGKLGGSSASDAGASSAPGAAAAARASAAARCDERARTTSQLLFDEAKDGGDGDDFGSAGGSIVLEGSDGEGEAKPKKGSVREERRKKRARETALADNSQEESQVEITGVRSREEKDAEGRANAIDVDWPSGEAGGSEAEARPAQRPRVERSVRERLVELKSLHEEGLISEANFEARQRVILDDM